MLIMNVKALNLGLVVLLGAACTTLVSASDMFSNSDGVVTDSRASLQWQDNYADNGGDVKSGSFVEAEQYCSELGLLDKQDWRVPTREELLSTVDKSRSQDDQPAIHKIFTQVLTEEGYLSSTNHEDDDETVWLVDYTYGDSDDVAMTTADGYHIRCVRAN